MALTPGLVRALEAAEIEDAARAKERWVARLRAAMTAIDPALSALELAVGLGIDPPPPMLAIPGTTKRPRITTVGRWLSDAPRHLRVVPDAQLAALFDKLEAGLALMCVGRERGLDGLRPLVFCEPWEVERLGHDLDVVRLGPGPAARIDASIDFSGGAPGTTGTTPTSSPNAPLSTRRAAPRLVLAGADIPTLGFGSMRLATAGHPPNDAAVAVLRRAFELGLRLVDTADAYAVDDRDMHAGERLVRTALAGWPSAERDRVLIATKAGLVRPGGRWLPDGRPEHLRSACEGSLRALGLEALPLWQLHVRDRKVPFEDSLGALVDLHHEGKVRHLGVCNVGLDDLRTALRVLPTGAFVSVQNALSPFDTTDADVIALAKDKGLVFLAHSPLGGHRGVSKILRRPVFQTIAALHGTSPYAVALAWLMSLGPHIVPLVGATQLSSIESSHDALGLVLSDADLQTLDQAFPKIAALRGAAPPPEPPDDETAESVTVYSAEPIAAPGDAPEVVVIMGIPGAGKSTLVAPYLAAGYLRLNRDERGGKLDGLIAPLRNALAGGSRRVVLDNTYPTRRSRAPVVEAAREAGVPVRCLWLDTPIEDARWNAAMRMIIRHQRLLGPDEINVLAKEYADTIPPRAQTTWLETFEPPTPREGFERIERRPFQRRPAVLGKRGSDKGLLLDVDGTIRVTRSGEPYPRVASDVVLLPHRQEILHRWRADGWRLFFVSNQSGIHSGRVTRKAVDEAFAKTIDLLGVPIDEVIYCPHQAFPVACFCRKPMPGLVAWLVARHGLDRDLLTIVGDQPADRELARAVGARYVAADTFFGGGGRRT